MRYLVACVVVVVVGFVDPARAAPPPEPAGPHPRMLLDADVRAAWKADARQRRGPIAGAIRLCQEAADTTEYDRAQYQGEVWAKTLQACLVAWAATERPVFAKASVRFFTALIDDLDRVGDGLGGEEAGRRDHGYAIRNLGPYTALAYDWLYNHPLMTPQLKARARQRWAAWLDWYKTSGYRAREPGTNYQAGYLAAATLIAIAQSGDDGGGALWRFVADELWGKDMAKAFASGGILDGGDWPEGWQYGPLAVAHYALAARIARRAGIEITGVDAWLAAMLRRHVYGLSPADRVYVAQDTQVETPAIEPSVLTLDAIALGDASPDDRRWAKGELGRLGLADDKFLLYNALAAAAREKPAPIPRASWPTWYATAATQTIFARTRWDARAIWFVTECARALDVDHRHPKAGNFVLSRGGDDAIVDPSPYGSQSTLTSNAPTVASGHLPDNYVPSQGGWGERTGWDWATQTSSGVVAARCDYSDQYRFQHRPSDVPDALRDFVLLPSADGTDAVLIVADRATTGSAERGLNLRFRVPGKLALAGDVGTATVGPGKTRVAIAPLERTSGTPAIVSSTDKDCFKEGTVRGKCDAARFPVSDYRIELAGAKPRAVHVISATGGATTKATAIKGESWSGIELTGVRDAVVIWPHKSGAPFSYRAPRGPRLHVILGAPALATAASITGRAAGKDCEVRVDGSAPAGGTGRAQAAIVSLDAACAVSADPEAASAASASRPPAGPSSRAKRSGCCSADSGPAAPAATALLIGAVLLRPRRRRAA